ncbi:MAG: PEP-CTERM sorting domain-containing protein [Oscillatoriales cyanobacterium RM1_1_9]|nr:PEP-CTERM sorting domain-containing protein [Oscillatoriales cyanobacterium SM2_3_0]NJO46527.1 PEP-CTERM sorting domain-containing protein [Oscillatoriales cyanobacterium RM2_1_1]NJO70959.1 PEP-CTERM sorting domain-containing protein [Oscillatoriales cyanobacterium RM1_1_9]
MVRIYQATTLALLIGLIAHPVQAVQLVFNLEGSFTDDNFLPGGHFKGIFSYDPEVPDSNPNISNVGIFEFDQFEVRIFDAQFNLMDILDQNNSIGRISLSDMDASVAGADQYRVYTTQDTDANGNAFFEMGAINLRFDWTFGGDPNAAPAIAPQQFVEGQFASYAATGSFDSFIDPQAVVRAEVKPVPEPLSLSGSIAALLLGFGALWKRKH